MIDDATNMITLSSVEGDKPDFTKFRFSEVLHNQITDALAHYRLNALKKLLFIQ